MALLAYGVQPIHVNRRRRCDDNGDGADDGGEGYDHSPLPQPHPPAFFHGLVLGAGIGIPSGDNGVAVGLHGLAAHHARVCAAADWLPIALLSPPETVTCPGAEAPTTAFVPPSAPYWELQWIVGRSPVITNWITWSAASLSGTT